MKFKVILSEKARTDIERFKNSGDIKSLKKIHALLEELELHPSKGTGKPKRLKYFNEPTWSRRISQKHRLIYEIQDEKIIVLVISAFGRYDNH